MDFTFHTHWISPQLIMKLRATIWGHRFSDILFCIYILFYFFYYLALDAYCLLLVYEKLFHVIRNLNLTFDEVLKKTLSTSLKVVNEKKSNKAAHIVKQQVLQKAFVIFVFAFDFFCGPVRCSCLEVLLNIIFAFYPSFLQMAPSYYPKTPVSEFKVVVDNMLHGLGKYLRLCGADVAFLDNDDDHMQAVQVSHFKR